MIHPNPLLHAALQHLGVERLTPMQEAALASASHHPDLLLLSPTGSGKTLAYLLPLLAASAEAPAGTCSLVLVPSRELAIQTAGVWSRMQTGLPLCLCYGGHSFADEHRALEGSRPVVVVGTPGRVLDHLRRGSLAGGSVRTLVVDEFDKCLELGFHDEMSAVCGLLTAVRRRILLSATEGVEVPAFVGMAEPCRLCFLTAEDGARLTLHQVLSPERDKLASLLRLLSALHYRPALVFVGYRDAAERVAGFLAAQGVEAEVYHGGMEQRERERALFRFRSGCAHVLVSTDLASRGLDIPAVGHVVHYHLPASEEAFVHRNGRTARWEADGHAYLLRHADEALPGWLAGGEPPVFALPEAVLPPGPTPWTMLYVGRGRRDKLSRADLAGFFYKKGGLGRDDLGPIEVREREAYVAVRRSRAAQTLALVRGEKLKGLRVLVEEARQGGK